MISYEPLELPDNMNSKQGLGQEAIGALYHLLNEDPEAALEKAKSYISTYPTLPVLYNYLYGAYRKLNRPLEAMKILKDTVPLVLLQPVRPLIVPWSELRIHIIAFGSNHSTKLRKSS